MSFLNVDWNNFKIMDVVKGCGNAILSQLNLQDNDLKEIAQFRLDICNSCNLYRNNRCFRDWNNEDNEKFNKIIEKINILDSDPFEKRRLIEKERQEYIKLYKIHTIHKGRVHIGCGCNMDCKIFSLGSSCPAGKWDSVKNPS